jgi:copper transport protein
MITWPLAGHAAAGSRTALTIAVDLLHLGAMAIWLGGLAVIVVGLRPAAQAADLQRVLPLFSRLAFGCVVALVVSGTYQAWRDVGTVPALYRTTYGQVLLFKLGAVAVVIGLGGLARAWVRRNLTRSAVPAAGALPARSLHRGLVAEIAVGAGVLALTAALVVLVPGRQSYVPRFDRTVTAAGVQVAVRIDAPRVGDTVMHLTALTSSGRPMPVLDLRGSLSLRAKGLGPLALRGNGATANGREDLGVSFPRPGRWLVQLTVQTGPLEAIVFDLTVPVT